MKRYFCTSTCLADVRVPQTLRLTGTGCVDERVCSPSTALLSLTFRFSLSLSLSLCARLNVFFILSLSHTLPAFQCILCVFPVLFISIVPIASRRCASASTSVSVLAQTKEGMTERERERDWTATTAIVVLVCKSAAAAVAAAAVFFHPRFPCYSPVSHVPKAVMEWNGMKCVCVCVCASECLVFRRLFS